MPFFLARLAVAPLPYRLRNVGLQRLVLQPCYFWKFELIHHPSFLLPPISCRVLPATASASSDFLDLGLSDGGFKPPDSVLPESTCSDSRPGFEPGILNSSDLMYALTEAIPARAFTSSYSSVVSRIV